MVLCRRCGHCIGMILGEAILCDVTNREEGYRLVHWECAEDDQEGCSSYVRNLHDDNAARQDPETRNNGIHQEE